MHLSLPAIALAAAIVTLVPAPALGRAQATAQPVERPITDRQPSAADVAATPLNDLNLRKADIPPLLIAAQAAPYDAHGLTRCPAIASAVNELDRVLGDDVDLPQAEKDRVSAGKVAQSLIGKFIPFRSVIRELSGANAHERRVDDAIEAGIARRAFLKGLGQAKGCRYPASAATARIVAAKTAATEPTQATATRAEAADSRTSRSEVAAAYAKAEEERLAAEKTRGARPQRR